MSVIFNQEIVLVGYGGNSYLIIEILNSAGAKVNYYLDNSPKEHNPFNLKYLGNDDDIIYDDSKKYKFISAIGNNLVRQKTQVSLTIKGFDFINCIHQSSVISSSCKLGQGVFISAYAAINPFSIIGNGVICNTSSVIEHEATIDDFVHIGPGAVICGKVSIGSCSFIGAGAVIKQGVTIGRNVIVGAGAVVISDVPNDCTVVGVPAKIIYR